jgi:hypothetical protein
MVHREDVCRVTAMTTLAPGVDLIPLALGAGSLAARFSGRF